jgi:hypothetical protein
MRLHDLAMALREAVDHAPRREKVVTIHLFGIDHADELRGVSLHELVDAAGIQKSYATEINKGVNLSADVRRR